MGSFVLSCESTADYPRSFFEARGIEYIMFHYELDGVVHCVWQEFCRHIGMTESTLWHRLMLTVLPDAGW